ncbi:MAG: HAD-IA family hydrolase [Anaerolineae bacterium]|nr:HAD-IA family hydrolase [Anaerolineae bacterium]MDH7473649.1 HAD-IA family hydrolase [Anaerolineae bacterium]
MRGLIFDVDGVLVDSPHERAWGETLKLLMETEWQDIRPTTDYAPDKYTNALYQAHVAGKPRLSGAQSLLACFHVPDPDGARARRLAERKQALIVSLIERGEFTAYNDALHFALLARSKGHRLAAASSSKNANAMLKRVSMSAFCQAEGLRYDFVGPDTMLIDLFDANLCGQTFTQGKPHPEIFLTAARELDLPPAECIVIEDAVAGVQAAKAGGMACIGVARFGDRPGLEAAGADWIVSRLDEIMWIL